jgi:hypothetical protein
MIHLIHTNTNTVQSRSSKPIVYIEHHTFFASRVSVMDKIYPFCHELYEILSLIIVGSRSNYPPLRQRMQNPDISFCFRYIRMRTGVRSGVAYEFHLQIHRVEYLIRVWDFEKVSNETMNSSQTLSNSRSQD